MKPLITRLLEGSKNQGHPELRPGEVFLTNSFADAKAIGYISKRIGKMAYDIYGNTIEDYVPVFVSKDEFEKNVKA